MSSYETITLLSERQQSSFTVAAILHKTHSLGLLPSFSPDLNQTSILMLINILENYNYRNHSLSFNSV